MNTCVEQHKSFKTTKKKLHAFKAVSILKEKTKQNTSILEYFSSFNINQAILYASIF